MNGLNCIYVERRLYEIFVSKYLNVETRKTIGALLYSNAGKSSVQSSELNAKSDTNEIKLMVTDHADGNRFLHYTSLCHCDKPTAGLNSGETRIVLFYPGYWLEDGEWRSISIIGFCLPIAILITKPSKE